MEFGSRREGTCSANSFCAQRLRQAPSLQSRIHSPPKPHHRFNPNSKLLFRAPLGGNSMARTKTAPKRGRLPCSSGEKGIVWRFGKLKWRGEAQKKTGHESPERRPFAPITAAGLWEIYLRHTAVQTRNRQEFRIKSVSRPRFRQDKSESPWNNGLLLSKVVKVSSGNNHAKSQLSPKLSPIVVSSHPGCPAGLIRFNVGLPPNTL
jgi:hypothetical protein